jgi:hypothetical protein
MAHPLVERLRRIARTFEDCTAEERRYIANLAEEIDRLLCSNAEPDGRSGEGEGTCSTVARIASAFERRVSSAVASVLRELGLTPHGRFH